MYILKIVLAFLHFSRIAHRWALKGTASWDLLPSFFLLHQPIWGPNEQTETFRDSPQTKIGLHCLSQSGTKLPDVFPNAGQIVCTVFFLVATLAHFRRWRP